MEASEKIIFYPVISSIQKVALYEDKNTYIVVGSNQTETKFRVLKINRTEPKNLSVIDDGLEYSKIDIVRLLERNETGRAKYSRRPTLAAYGILGFVRFLEGYYIILITKRQSVAQIGHHTIYKVKDTSIIYLPQDVAKSQNPLEMKYVKIFQNIDLSSNFYFSYDLTHTLQHNLAPPSDFPLNAFENDQSKSELHFAVRAEPSDRFVWNWHLTQPVRGLIHPDWLLHLIHGFVDQSNVSIYGRSIYVTLIARRSRKYAGTRFLKRGSNFEGDVANEVETEQMVHDASISSFQKGHFSSFVQLRGSIPGHWSQDISKMVPKPQIIFDLGDPFGETSGQHFNQLLRRYGSPIIILNLVKKRETKKQESVLSTELMTSVEQLNQYLPPRFHIRYTSFDMARMNKTKDTNVMQRLADIAKRCVEKTGIFVSKLHKIDRNHPTRQFQSGVVRVNCVDCLDRTNTAQFAIGRYALGVQLCALGILSKPFLKFDTDCVRMLEVLYEDHGDTLALQYGGSQLVHRIKTYRKTAPWTSQGNDIMQTLSRYYSNTFSDADKQNAINLFLGLFDPKTSENYIWESITDYYLHHTWAMGNFPIRTRPSSHWWDPEILGYLPMSYEEKNKRSIELFAIRPKDEAVDAYADYHRPHELTVIGESFTFKISHSVRDFMPDFTTNFSPFTVRIRPGRQHEESGKPSIKNPSLTGQSSTGSTNSSGSSSSESHEESLSAAEEEGEEEEEDAKTDSRVDFLKENVRFSDLFPSMFKVYGVELKTPSEKDLFIYKRYRKFYENSTKRSRKQDIMFVPFKTCNVSAKLSEKSVIKYQDYVKKGLFGASPLSSQDKEIHDNYLSLVSNKIRSRE